MSAKGWALPAKVRHNIGFKLAGTVVEKGLRALIVFTAARVLGPDAWGRYTYAFALAMLMVQATDLGLGLFMNRETARHQAANAELIGQAMTLKALLAAVFVGATGLVAWAHIDSQHGQTVAVALLLCGGVALSSSIIESLVHVFRGVQDLSLEAKVHSMHAVFAVIAGGAALTASVAMWGWDMPASRRDHTGWLYAGAMFVAGVLGAIYAFALTRRVVVMQWGLSRSLVRRFRSEVLPLGIAIVASMLYFRIDVPMIRNLLPPETADAQTGLYTAAYKLLEQTALFPSILMAAAFPALAETVANDPSKAVALHRTTLRWMLLGGGALCVVFAALSEPIIGLLYGDRFAASAPVLMALAPCVLLTFVNYLETHMLVALGLVKAQMAISLGLIAVNVGLNWFWIPLWQGSGAAWATAATEVCLFVAVAPLVRRGLRERVQRLEPSTSQSASEPS